MTGAEQDRRTQSSAAFRASVISPVSGFSIIEICVVLVIAGMMIVGLISLYKQYQRGHYLVTVREQQETIIGAIQDFYTQNGYLPCAADPSLPPSNSKYGHGDKATGTDCSSPAGASMPRVNGARFASAIDTVRIGAVPVRSIGLSDSYIATPDGYMFIYAITERVARDDYAHNSPPNTTIDLSQGQIEIKHPQTMNSVVSPAGSALYAVISPGRDGNGAWTVNGKHAACVAGTQDYNNCKNTYQATATSTFVGGGLSYSDN